MKTIAFFDFDGSIIKGDSMLMYVKECCGQWAMLKGMIAIIPKIISLKHGSKNYFGLKEKFFKYTIKGKHRTELEKCAETLLPKLEESVWPIMHERLNWHEQSGHEIVIVSASAEIWLRPWTNMRGYALTGSKLEFQDDIFTGKLSTPNCKGPEKVKRILEIYELSEYDEVYGYGDTVSDIPMLEITNQPYWISGGKMSEFQKS